MPSTILTSVITGGSNSHATTAADVNALGTDFLTAGCVGTLGSTNGVAPNTGSFAVNAQGTPAMLVDITAGQAWITATPSGQASQKLRANMSANYTSYAISANASGSTKFDWVYLSIDATKAGGTEDSAADDVTSLVTSRSSSNSTDNGTPPTYGILLAKITVANGASSITNANITDARTQATVSVAASSNGWTTGLATPNTVTANGNRSYSLVFNGTDLTSTLSPGMRLRTSRLVTAPTQCTSLNGTTQFYSKSSPAGMTFTDDFVVSAWVKLTQYGQFNAVASRYNGTSGWTLQINDVGQVRLIGFNASASNFSQVLSYQSIPLNKWVHVAAQLDMSSFTATPTTSYTMIDGVDAPAAVSRAGTNPTALIQPSADFQIGSDNSTDFFHGKLSQVAVYSAKVTQANILATISQGLAGTETSLISAYSFSNSITDLNANANNLTANGSAVATNTDSPFTINSLGTATGSTDYAIITSCTFSTNTTMVVQVPEANTIPVSGGVSAVAYSLQKVPYGFPMQREKWVVGCIGRTDSEQASPVNGTWYNPGLPVLNVPIGSWRLYTESLTYAYKSSTVALDISTSLSTSNNSESDPEFTTRQIIEGASATLDNSITLHREKYLSTVAATNYYLICKSNVAGATSIGFRGDLSTLLIYAENAYL